MEVFLYLVLEFFFLTFCKQGFPLPLNVNLKSSLLIYFYKTIYNIVILNLSILISLFNELYRYSMDRLTSINDTEMTNDRVKGLATDLNK